MQTITLEVADNDYPKLLKVLENFSVRIIDDNELEDAELAALVEARKSQAEIEMAWHEL